MQSLWNDIRFGLRSLLANRRFTVVALLTIVLTVGAITTVFTLVNSVLLRPLPYPDSNRLLLLRQTARKGFAPTFNPMLISAGTFLESESAVRSFESVALFQLGVDTLDPESDPLQVQIITATPGLFPMIGLKTVLGRPLLAADAKQQNPSVALIGYDLWQNHYGGSPDVLGRPLQLGQHTYRIIGVMAPGIDIPRDSRTDPAIFIAIREPYLPGRADYNGIAKLRPGATLVMANAELQALSTGIESGLNARTVLDEAVGDTRQVLWIFLGAVSCVLMIGIANLVSLQIVRNSAREREICVRAALGAGRWRLIQQLLVETLLLSMTGGIAGLALAWGGTQALLATLPVSFPRAGQISIDATVFAFAFCVSLLVGIVFGTVPAWRASRPDLMTAINEGTRSATLSASRSRIQRGLIAFELSIAMILLVGATLLTKSFVHLITQDAGMQERGLWSVRVALPLRYRTPEEQFRFWNSAIENIRALVQVESATMMVNANTPLSGGGDTLGGGIFPEGKTGAPQDGMAISYRMVGDGYFNTLGIPIVRGRAILDSDRADTERVAVINELTASKLWPGEDPIGKRIAQGTRLLRVVGVIPSFKHIRLDETLSPQFYTAYRQEPRAGNGSVVMLRPKPGATGVSAALQTAIHNMEKDAKVTVSTMAEVRWKLVATERFRTEILLLFAAGAVFLSLVGIVGVVSYTIVQRKREIGLRLALGAESRDIIRLVVQQAMVPAMFGLAVGIAGSLAATRLLTSYLFQIESSDPGTFLIAFNVLAIAALGAGLLPARQALRVDPMVALRHE